MVVVGGNETMAATAVVEGGGDGTRTTDTTIDAVVATTVDMTVDTIGDTIGETGDMTDMTSTTSTGELYSGC